MLSLVRSATASLVPLLTFSLRGAPRCWPRQVLGARLQPHLDASLRRRRVRSRVLPPIGPLLRARVCPQLGPARGTLASSGADRPAAASGPRLAVAGPPRGAPGAHRGAERPANLKRAPLPCACPPTPARSKGVEEGRSFSRATKGYRNSWIPPGQSDYISYNNISRNICIYIVIQ